MARLIVEVGGQTRRFKLGDGKLTLGSGEGASLTLDSEDLADIHADLEVSGDSVTVATRKGTTAATKAGQKVSGAAKISAGQSVKIGEVKISIEGDAPKAAPKAAPRAAGAKKAAAPRSSGAGGGSRQRVQRSRPQAQEGIPTPVIIGGVLLVAIVGFFMFRGQVEGLSEEGFSAKTSDLHIQNGFKEGEIKAIREELAKVRRNWDTLDATYKAKFEGYEERLAEREKEAALIARNREGDSIFDKQLATYPQKYMNPPTRPYARVFLKRIDAFLKEYPLHEKADWCNQYKQRWGDLAALHEPPTIDDLEWEVKSMTHAMPRNYRQAFQLVDSFLTTADGSHKSMAESMRAELVTERKEYHDDRMQQARYYYEQGEAGKAVSWLVQLIVKLGDKGMEDDAASSLVALPGVKSAIQGYCNQGGELWEGLRRNAIVARYISDNNITPQR